jgi:hypothetical protein
VQTFLPYSRFDSSAAVLDDLRLGKQRVETLQILRALVWPSYKGWKNHPATAMWRGFTDALASYGVAVCAEWERRGRADAVRAGLLEFLGGIDPGQDELARRGRLPPWLGEPALHASHRASLVAKLPEHYRERFPDADPALPYVWPRPLFSRWPLRRNEASADGPAVRAILRASGPAWWVHDRPYEPAPAASALRSAPVASRGGKISPSIARPPTAQDLESVAAEIATPPLLHVYRAAAVRDRRTRAALAPPVLVVVEGEALRGRVESWYPDAEIVTVPAEG